MPIGDAPEVLALAEDVARVQPGVLGGARSMLLLLIVNKQVKLYARNRCGLEVTAATGYASAGALAVVLCLLIRPTIAW